MVTVTLHNLTGYHHLPLPTIRSDSSTMTSITDAAAIIKDMELSALLNKETFLEDFFDSTQNLGKEERLAAVLTECKKLHHRRGRFAHFIGALNTKLLDLEACISQQANELQAHIYKLSDEILSLIFTIIVEDPHCISNPFRKRSMPQVLSQISTRWRIIVLSMPRLWSTLQLNRSACTGEDIKDYKEALRCWAARASGTEVDLVFETSLYLGSTVTQQFTQAFQAMAPTLKSIRLECVNETTASLSDQTCTPNLKILRRLGGTAPLPNVIAPNLLVLQCVGDSIPDYSFTRKFSWSRLLELELAIAYTVTEEHVDALMEAASSIEALKLWFLTDREPEGLLFSSPVTFPRLQSLHLNRYSSPWIDSMITPALSSLSIAVNYRRWDGLLDFFNRSGCAQMVKSMRLHVYILKNMAWNKESWSRVNEKIIQFLTQSKNVEHLGLDALSEPDSRISVAIVRQIEKSSSSQETLLPHLRSLSLKSVWGLQEFVTALVDSRVREQAGCVRLTTLDLSNSKIERTAEFKARLDQWTQHGVDISL
jgi:hypothetical protein